MVRPDLIVARLERLDEYLGILRKFLRYSLEEFVSEPERYGGAERFLQLAIECVNDIGNHLVADRALGPTEWASDIPVRLCDACIIDAPLRDAWVRMIGFRNILVHDYTRIDRSLVYDVLQNRLEDFVRIRAALAAQL